MVTIKEIAKAAGVSNSTVSAVLRGRADDIGIKLDTRKLVRATAKKLGYARNDLARSMVTGKSRVIGFMTPEIDSEHTSRVLDGVTRAADKNDYFVKVLYSSDETDVDDLVEKCKRQRLDGVVAYGVLRKEYQRVMAEQLRAAGIRFTVVGGSMIVPGCDQLLVDNEGGGRLMFEHMRELGHRNVMVLEESMKSPWARARLKGFCETATRAGVSCEKLSFDQNREEDYETIVTWIESGVITAVFCLSDYSALRVLTFLQNNGFRIPDDVSISGFGNLPMSDLSNPTITSVDEGLHALGRGAVEKMIRDEKTDADIGLGKTETRPVRLAAKGSTSPPTSAI